MRLLKISIVLIFFFVIFFAYHFSSNAPVTTNEVFRNDETEQSRRSIATFIKNIEADKTSYVARGAHSKGHACVKAYFDVNATIPTELQHGIFAKPGKTFKSWIRFSKGKGGMKGNHDAHKDAHGMAVKLFNIYDDELKRIDDDSETQDFLMHDNPVFLLQIRRIIISFSKVKMSSCILFLDLIRLNGA